MWRTCPNANPCTVATIGATIQTIYVYDAAGNLAAEYSLTAQPSPPCLTCYITVDHLGSTRLLTDDNGNSVRRYDYLPFGEEIPSDGSVRTAGLGYQSTPDGLNPKFTGQMRDTESGLDFFNARYYSPAQGRFVSPDPDNAGFDMSDPQTWNGYAYVTNNPLAYIDPFGLQSVSSSSSSESNGGWNGTITYNPYDPTNPWGWISGPNPFVYYGLSSRRCKGLQSDSEWQPSIFADCAHRAPLHPKHYNHRLDSKKVH
jgi:RHS repeat-associated protein